MNTEVKPSSTKSLSDMLADLLAGGEAAIKAKKEGKKKKSINPFKDIVATKVNGEFKITTVDRRMEDSRWAVQHRIMLVRKVTCEHCGVSHVAPNETLMVKRSHPVHGIIEEAIGLHDGKYNHLPVKIEQHNTRIAFCQNCVNYIKVEILEPVQVECVCAKPGLTELFPTDAIIEEQLEEGDLGWEDPDNLAALEDF
jgi:hypothetical protein